MSFLRKWGSSSGPATATTAGGGGAATGDATKQEWYNEAPGERYFGMENFGNTCYANSVLQSLYFSKPFRELVEAYSRHGPGLPTPSSSSAPLIPSGSASSVASSLPKSPALNSAASLPPSTSIRHTSSRGAGMAAGGGRSGIFGGHKRAPSVQGQETASSADSTNSSLNGAPLTQTQTHTSFTGVGTPLLANGTLAHKRPPADSTLLTTLHDLFVAISSQPKSTGTVAPQAFINQLKRDNEFFRSTLHQDAHEFLNYLVNMIAEALEKEANERSAAGHPSVLGDAFHGAPKTWVHRLFEGVLTNETRCLTCETVTSRDEAFLDLSIDIEQNTSVTACLRQFSASEMLCQRNKFSCDKCCGLQEAEKRMKIKKLPNILALHLKRFKYEESLQRHVKLTYRVVFPFELRLFNTADGVSNPDRLYELWAIVVHIGVGPHHGHYITIVKSGARWIVFDDNNVYPIEESDISKYFGDTPGQGSGYVLFYQAVDLDLDGLGLRNPSRERTGTASSVSTAPPSNSWTEEPVLPMPTAAPSTASGLGLALSEHDFATTRPPGQPLSPKTSQVPLDSPPPLKDPSSAPAASFLQPQPPLPSGVAIPAPEFRKSSIPSIASTDRSTDRSVKGDTEKEGSSPQKESSGWTLKGRKMSIGGRIGRSISLASSNGAKESPRSVSTPVLVSADSPDPTSLPLPPSQSNRQFPGDSVPPHPSLAAEPQTNSSSTPPEPPLPPAEPPSPDTAAVPSASTPSYPVPLLPNPNHALSHPPPPSDDGSASTISTQGLAAPSVGSAPSPKRRGSKASVELNGSATSSATSNALSATRNFLSRKPRPLSTVNLPGGSGTATPSSNGIGLGIARPATASGRMPSSSSTPTTNGTSTPLLSLSAGGNEGGAMLRSSPSMLVSKKDMEKAEKRLKEERKQREKEEKKLAEEKVKQKKEEERRKKEEAKKADKADKIRRKASIK